MKNLFLLIVLLISSHSIAQNIDPFAIRYQVNQKGGLVMLANASIGCNCAANDQMPPGGNGDNNGNTMSFIDIDSDATTFMSSADQLNLPACSEITWAGLYWSGQLNNTPSTTPNWATRGQVRLKVDGGAYVTLLADELLDNTVGKVSYFGYRNITSIVQANGINSTYQVANVVGSTGFNVYGGWSIVVVYNNIYQSMRNITVFDGLANVSAGSAGTVNISLSGFLTPPTGPVNFELGVVAHDGDRAQTGDQLAFNGAGTYVNISDAIHPINNVFNSTISNNAVLTPLRNPSYNNNLGHDANIYVPNNATYNYIGNSATSALIRVSTTSETVLASVITSAIDIFEPDLRASVSYTDLNGGTVVPGDILEYKIVAKNIGSDVSIGTFLTDTLDARLTYMPGTMQISYGPNSGPKTDPIDIDQAEFLPATNVIRARIGTGANGITGGAVVNSPTGADSTVLKFQVQLTDDCLVWQCGSILENKAYLFGTGQISGITNGNNGASDLLDINGCPSLASGIVMVDVSDCADTVITHNDSLCVGENLWLNFPDSPFLTYSWTGPNGFTSTINDPTVSNVQLVNGGDYILSVTYDGVQCITDSIASIFISSIPTLQLNTLQNDSCFNAEVGFINVSGVGNAPFTYVWSNSDTDSLANDLGAGTYSVLAIDQYGCEVADTFSITEPLILNATASITSNYNGQNISCFGAMDGSANVLATGGTTPYSYEWSPGLQTSAALSGLDIGTYLVTVTDLNGCISIDSVTLTQPDSLIISGLVTNVPCFGDLAGSVNATITGGTTPYDYSWSNGTTLEDITNVAAGTYTDTVIDINGCSEMATFIITEPSAPLSMTDSVTHILCFGDTTGSIQLSVSGGVLPYTYIWSNGDADSLAENLGFGAYTVTVIDSNNCSISGNYAINQPPILTASASITSNYNGQDISCFGAMDGSANVTVGGGVLPYSYLWSPGLQTVDSITDLDFGTYIVEITDSNGCVVLDSVTLIQPDSLAISAITTDVLCFGDLSGAIDATIVGGTLPYSFSWSNGSILEDLISIGAGTYTDTVTDINGCTELATFVITEPSAPLTMSDSITEILCFGDSTGSIQLNVVGGVTPYSYSWSNGNLDDFAENLGIGTYIVVVLDSNNCSISDTFTLTQPTLLTAVASITSNYNGQDISCFGAMDASANVTINGGVSPYSYLWSPGLQTVDSINNLDAGTYTVTVTDLNSCAVIDSVSISQPDSILITAQTTDVFCYADLSGAIDVTVIGGTLPYAYSWSNGSLLEDLLNIGAGIYTDTVTDLNGCTSIASFTINQPLDSMLITAITSDILCFGDTTVSIDLSVVGGIVPYTYLWSNGETTQDLSNLGAGTYSVVVSDSNNCTQFFEVIVNQPPLLVLSETHLNPICANGTQGSIDLSVLGGTPGYSYVWNNGDFIQDIDDLYAGLYFVTVTDLNGCIDTMSITLTDPDAILITESIIDILCYSDSTGAIDISVSNGTPAYVYDWSNGAISQDLSNVPSGPYYVNVSDLNGCGGFMSFNLNQPDTALYVASNSSIDVFCYNDSIGEIDIEIAGGVAPYTYIWNNSQTSQDIQNLGAGIYTVVVTDFNLCQITFTDTILQPTELELSETHVNVLCFGDSTASIDITTTGGVEPYTYSWINGEVTEDLSNIPFGNYSLTVTDFNNCTDTISIMITQPNAPLSLSSSQTNVLCFGGNNGAIELSVSGGTPGYSYLWNTSDTIQDLNSLLADTYTVSVTDANGCVDTLSANISEPLAPISITGSSSPTCFGSSIGAIDITVVGGTNPYTYLWSNSAITQDLQGLAPGIYSVTVTDSNLCEMTYTDTIVQPTELVLSETHENVLCFGQSTGSIDITTTGGVLQYTYLWNGGSTNEDLENLSTGVYSLTVTDSDNCTDTISVFISQPPSAINISSSVIPANCNGSSNGSIDVSLSGGTPVYNYSWDSGQSTEDLESISAGTYTLVVTDANGCTETHTATVNQPDAISLTTTSSQICYGDSDGEVSVAASGGTPGYNYLWSTGSTNAYNYNLPVGNYSVSVVDANGCESVTTAEVGILLNGEGCVFIDMPNVFTPNGDGANDVFIPIQILGITDYNLIILNRWGIVVYESNDYTLGWDGRTQSGEEATDGVYFWKINYTDVYDKADKIHGNLTLIRH